MLRDPEFGRELAVQVERSPRFFQNAPVVLDLKGADGFTDAAEFDEARDLLREHTLALVGVQNAEPAQLDAAAAAGLASFAPSATTANSAPEPRSSRCRRPPRPKPRPSPPPARQRHGWSPSRSAPAPRSTPAAAISIVTAAVSAGAELMADGNIHVYGRAARPGPGRRRAATQRRGSSARGSKPSWSASPGAIWSANNCRRNIRAAAVQIALVDDRVDNHPKLTGDPGGSEYT